MYIGSINITIEQKIPKGIYKKITLKNPNYPLLRLFKNSISKKFPIFNETWGHSQSDLMKFFFNLWFESSSLLKILWFCSFHMHHKRHRGSICQTWRLNFHLRRRFFIIAGNTHFRLKIAKRNVHSCLVLSQWIKMWLFDFSLALH